MTIIAPQMPISHAYWETHLLNLLSGRLRLLEHQVNNTRHVFFVERLFAGDTPPARAYHILSQSVQGGDIENYSFVDHWLVHCPLRVDGRILSQLI